MSSKTAITFVAMGPNAWGRGKTAAIALRNCKENIGSHWDGKPCKVHVFKVKGFCFVTGMGYINAHHPPVEVEVVTVTMPSERA